jgi:hypothetical protein
MTDKLSAEQQCKSAQMCLNVAIELMHAGSVRQAREYIRSAETALQRAARNLEESK